MKPKNQSREKLLSLFDKFTKDIVKKVRLTTYRMPQNFISWEILSKIIALSLTICQNKSRADNATLMHSYRMSLWFAEQAPMYCITSEMMKSFPTYILNIKGILDGWKPSLPSFLVALPKGEIYSADGGEIDYLVVSVSVYEHPEWETSQWNDIKIEESSKMEPGNYYIQACTLDSKEFIWVCGLIVDNSGNVSYKRNPELNSTEDDEKFFIVIRNLVINILLAIEFSPSLFSDMKESDFPAVSKGFGGNKTSSFRYPRWIGKEYQKLSDSKPHSTHASPTSHWRRGHWRTLKPGENKKWKQHRRIWIEPVFIE